MDESSESMKLDESKNFIQERSSQMKKVNSFTQDSGVTSLTGEMSPLPSRNIEEDCSSWTSQMRGAKRWEIARERHIKKNEMHLKNRGLSSIQTVEGEDAFDLKELNASLPSVSPKKSNSIGSGNEWWKGRFPPVRVCRIERFQVPLPHFCLSTHCLKLGKMLSSTPSSTFEAPRPCHNFSREQPQVNDKTLELARRFLKMKRRVRQLLSSKSEKPPTSDDQKEIESSDSKKILQGRLENQRSSVDSSIHMISKLSLSDKKLDEKPLVDAPIEKQSVNVAPLLKRGWDLNKQWLADFQPSSEKQAVKDGEKKVATLAHLAAENRHNRLKEIREKHRLMLLNSQRNILPEPEQQNSSSHQTVIASRPPTFSKKNFRESLNFSEEQLSHRSLYSMLMYRASKRAFRKSCEALRKKVSDKVIPD